MPEVVRPSWLHLQEVMNNAESDLIVCSPYYSAQGMGRIFNDFDTQACLHFWTRLSPSDWAARASDPEQLFTLLERLSDNGVEVKLATIQRLHAKVYAADRTLALIGSSNLSEGGFGTNLELMVRLHDEEAANAIRSVEEICQPSLRHVSLEQLRSWVTSAQPAIEAYRRASVEKLEVLSPAQEKLDEILDYGGTDSPAIVEPKLSDEQMFVQWLRVNGGLTGATTLLSYYDNVASDNRAGHCHQSFFASLRFLTESPGLQQPLSQELNNLGSNEIFQMSTPDLAQLWLSHIDAHATDRGDEYDYSTLRNILPPSLGGTYTRGGGAGSIMKRTFPLVARFMLEAYK